MSDREEQVKKSKEGQQELPKRKDHTFGRRSMYV